MLDSNLSFGLQKKSSLIFGTGKIGSIYPINAYEKVITTNKEFVKIEDTTIKKTFNCQFSTSLFIEEANLIVAASAQKSELYVFTLNDVNNPIIANFPTNQLGIFHLIYSKRSSVLLTLGFGAKIWNFNITIPDRRRSTLKPIVDISLRYSFSGDDSNPVLSPEVSNYEASILIPPSFDYSDEIIFLPSSKGIFGYDINGKQKVVMYRLPSSNKTAYCYLEKKKEMLVYDNTNGLVLCTTSGFVQSRPLVGTTTLIWMDFLDTENALLMDAKGSFYILDLKTGRSFHCYSVLNSGTSATVTQTHQKTIDPTLSMMEVLGQSNSMSGLCEINGGYGGLSTAKRMPSRVFLLRDTKEVCMCFGPRLETFKIDIPWTLWAINISKTKSLRRIEKPGEAARVVAFTSNSFVKIFSPKDGKILTDATPISLSSPANFFYDRGYLIYYKGKDDQNHFMVKKVHETQTEEKLFVILDDGSISVFDPNQNPCKEIGMANLKANSITVCYFNNEFCYAISSHHSGEIYLVDKFNFNNIKKKFKISNDTFCSLIFDPISVSLVCVMNRETVLFDLQAQKVVSVLKLRGSSLVSLNNGLLYYGYENGDINFVKIENKSSGKELVLLSKEPNKLHFDSVTGFAFSQSFWVSVSADQTVRYWDYSNGNFFTITMPCRLFGCEIINGKRDVVVGTDNELMLIDGKTVFDGEIDEVDSTVDNFDIQCDDFQKVLIENVMRMNREEEEKRKEIELRLKKQQQRITKDDKNKQKHRKFNINMPVLNNDQIAPQKAEETKEPLTDEMKLKLKEEEEKRRNKAFEAMMDITDHDRKFRQRALERQKEAENANKNDDKKSNSEWSIKMNSKDDPPPNKKDEKESQEIVKNDEKNAVLQITAPSVIMKPENSNKNDENTAHAPRRKRKKKVHHDPKQEEEQSNSKIEKTTENTTIEIPTKSHENTIQQKDDEKTHNFTTNENVNHLQNDSIQKEETQTFSLKTKTQKTSDNYTNTVVENSNTLIKPTNKFNQITSTDTESITTDSFNSIQPPKIEAKTIRNKKSSQTKPRLENVATSPISTLRHPCEEDEATATNLQDSEEPKPIKSLRKLRRKDRLFSFKKSPKIPFNQKRFPTPPQVVRRIFATTKVTDRKRRRTRSSQGDRLSNQFFEIPPPQFVLDIEAVRSQFGRGKVELLPIVQRLENSASQMKVLKLNEGTQFLNDELNNSMGSNNSSEKVRPLIEQPSKKIVTPLTKPKRNKSLGGRVKMQFPSRTARRPLGHYENSVTYINSANPTPRQLIPKSKKSSSSVDNKKNQNLGAHEKE